jgi:RNA polymerase sigma-70 factor (ECF subfamily)
MQPPRTGEETDEALAARAQAGDAEAFTVVVHRYKTPLFRYAQRMLGNVQDAEDVFQETFLRVHRSLDRYDSRRPFKPWLYRIAANLCRDGLRHRMRRRGLSLDRLLSDDNPASGTLGDTVPGAEAADGPARTEETQRRIAEALAGLSLKHREVFVLARYEGLTYEEIAATLDVPLGTVKSRMSNAGAALFKALEDLR